MAMEKVIKGYGNTGSFITLYNLFSSMLRKRNLQNNNLPEGLPFISHRSSKPHYIHYHQLHGYDIIKITR